MATRRVMACYAAWMALLVVAVNAEPGWDVVFWGLAGLSSSAAILVGVARHRPRRRWPWWLLAAGLVTFTAGDVTYGVLARLGHKVFPSLADVFYLAMGPMLAAGLFGLASSGAGRRDRGSLLDTLTLTSGLALLSWVLLVSPSVGAAGDAYPEKAILVSYPLCDVLLLATVARLYATARRSPAVTLLMAGAGGLLAADVLYGLTVANHAYHTGGPIDVGWFALYACWAAAGLHPSMVGLTEPAVPTRAEVRSRRLVLLALSSLIAPAVLFGQAVTGKVRDGVVIAVLSAAMFLLVLGRLADAANTLRRAVARERGLRTAGGALLSATDAAEVTAAVRAAVAHLLPPDTPHRVVLANGGAEAGPARLMRVADLAALTAQDAERLAGFEYAIACPLVLSGGPDSRSASGSGARDESAGSRPDLLLVGADSTALVGLRDSLEVLAAQAALALERVALSNEVQRRATEEYFRTLVHNTADVILIVNEDDAVRYASPSAAAVFGRESLTGVALHDMLHTGERAGLQDVMRAEDWTSPCRATDLLHPEAGGCEWVDCSVPRPDGARVPVEVTCRDLRADQTVRGLVITLRDVTERRRLERELTRQAFHDALTGLANRALFAERVEQAVTRSHHSGATVGVLFVDLDDFKVVNDTMGHAAGDDLLVAVGRRLSEVLGPADVAARLGGDEFAALTERTGHPDEVEGVAERVVAALAEPFQLADRVVNGAASVGVATSAETTDAQELLRQADLALYVAKGAGKGRWRRYQPALHAEVMQRLHLRAALDQAVTDQAFTLEYQPIVALAGGGTVGFEALVRWNHPGRGLIGPGQFIDVAEETGLIEPIGNWVLEEAVDAAARWCRGYPEANPPYVSINVSVRQFRTPGFVDRVRRTLAVAGLPPAQLLLEITESLLLRDDEQVWSDLTVLREFGVRTAIDDFGTGFSSLSYLGQTPIDVLKIDRSFTDTVASSMRQRALVDGIVGLANTLGLQVIAEGIETPTDRDLLAALGCPYGQGYLFSRPLSHDGAVQWLLAEQEVAGSTAERVYLT